MTAVVLRGDARALPLADESVDLIVTSPPYFALRSYTDGGEHYAAQIGSEPTPGEYIAALLECTREWVRVLKPSGSLWVNLGDKYAQPGKGERNMQGLSGSIVHKVGAAQANRSARDIGYDGVRGKSLIGLPWRYALGCIDDLGLILRAEVIWAKANPMPESVTDRVRRSHEQWFHLTKEPRYYSAVDEVREPHTDTSTHAMSRRTRNDARLSAAHAGQTTAANPLGKLPGSVWEIATQPLTVPEYLTVDHFAAFPPALVRRIILGWSPPGICTACGEGRRPVVHRDRLNTRPLLTTTALLAAHEGDDRRSFSRGETAASITGYACACPEPTAPTRPSVVLDPFGGTGTVSMVADVLGRHGISIDASHDYGRIARWRTADPRERARALGVKPPPAVCDEQLGFDLEAS